MLLHISSVYDCTLLIFIFPLPFLVTIMNFSFMTGSDCLLVMTRPLLIHIWLDLGTLPTSTSSSDGMLFSYIFICNTVYLLYTNYKHIFNFICKLLLIDSISILFYLLHFNLFYFMYIYCVYIWIVYALTHMWWLENNLQEIISRSTM